VPEKKDFLRLSLPWVLDVTQDAAGRLSRTFRALSFAVVATCVPVGGCSASGADASVATGVGAIVYGSDDRVEYYPYGDPGFRRLVAQSSVALIDESFVKTGPDGRVALLAESYLPAKIDAGGHVTDRRGPAPNGAGVVRRVSFSRRNRSGDVEAGLFIAHDRWDGNLKPAANTEARLLPDSLRILVVVAG
jgi:hypothetical protein